MMSGWGVGLGGVGFVFMAVFWIGIIAAAVWLLGTLFPRNLTTRRPDGAAETAVDVLKRRYASGELSREEFESMRHDIEG